jgi:hypothetical protein
MKILVGGLSGLLILLSILLIFKKETPVKIITVPKIYSYVQSDSQDTIAIDILSTSPNGYWFDQQYIEGINISNTKTTLSLEMVNRVISTDGYVVNSLTYYPIRLYVRPKVLIPNQFVIIDDANLNVYYGNGENLSLHIGELSLYYKQLDNTDILLGSLSATHDFIEGIDTVSSISVELFNNTSDIIEVLGIDVLANNVFTNMALLQIDQPCTTETLTECFGLDEYHFFLPRSDKTIYVQYLPYQSHSLSVPLLYKKNVPFHRFSIIVTYRIKGEIKEMVMDDFPFIRTSSFQKGYESGYITYDLN